ncbi:hypothetical protein B9G98_03401 [Wickerhamiella sorbophila]|uniref:Queuosine 5'-phosphate N-glycosylase/hydrolase n=1 Tax=Wickerhamiella sorbophila TaxID=45607 RepID=A0A2T0FLB6_9ASCO|nr:hypothetical protein B9G98_03401 [Wickerhamiella sorbophila]PRT55781.1 hypothetical protein B9G98_03401 [Wickerhamiella sorbophila]
MDVRSSAIFIAQNAQYVSVDPAACREVAAGIYDQIQRQKYSTQTWATHELNQRCKLLDTEGQVDWVFTVDTLNFSFWSDRETSERYTVEYNGKKYTGYWSLCAAINRALDEGIPVTTPAFWRSDEFNLEACAHIFRSCTAEQIPLLDQRLAVLKEAGAALANTAFSDVLRSCNCSASRLLDWVTTNLQSYNDRFVYRNMKVSILKRAQILVGELWACFNGEGLGRFDDIDNITMFADYRVPRILYRLNCLRYSDQLEAVLRAGTLMESGSDAEIELRGTSIEAVEQIVHHIKTEHPETAVNAILVDFYLWDAAKAQEQSATIPCHRVRSVFY